MAVAILATGSQSRHPATADLHLEITMTTNVNTLIDSNGQTLINVRNVLAMVQSVDLSEGIADGVELGIYRTLDACIAALDFEIAKGAA